MTVPHVGNTGMVPGDGESERIQVAGLVVREATLRASSWRARADLPGTLRAQGVVALEGVDTRALTLHLRERGAMRAVLSTRELDPAVLLPRVLASPSMTGRDLTGLVTCASSHAWTALESGFPAPREPRAAAPDAIAAPPAPAPPGAGPLAPTVAEPVSAGAPAASPPGGRYRVAALDYGAKANIFRILHGRGCDLEVVRSSAGAREILDAGPDGIFVSNGPGDPEAVRHAIAALRDLHRLAPEVPVFGICLGCQLLALAHGGDTFKLRFGHRGVNHPVRNRDREAVEITSQNHGFAVRGDERRVEGAPALEVTHVNLNDGTLEGFRHREAPVFAVQYHPEAAPGPHDSRYLFDEFVEAMARRRRGGTS
jgi:carbamoyl-phosphate synthase small subunit